MGETAWGSRTAAEKPWRGRGHPAAHRHGPDRHPPSQLRGLGRGSCEMRWVRRTLTPRRPRAPNCPPRRRSPTYNAVAANANARHSGWVSLTPTERDVVRLVSKGLATKTSPPGFSSHRALCKPTSPTSTPNSAAPPASSSPKKRLATPERHVAHARRGEGHGAIRSFNRVRVRYSGATHQYRSVVARHHCLEPR